ncbi:YbaB/EbfC family nucleoid-associated protein [Cellulomonas sp.]|uniref:YbaB/EbfC family nucleoid-associated protein n=1 Tax=Cellulomonas sp. TaxID=40001 RepID=UPI002588D6E3|nr:YbaB/EbfC family nucleoid-associated protein [Cellulomonas sp.]MCR6690702.1 YbaB/EbfC family nucleoid-associated protein [Cellulomonas sp.]
MVEDGRAVGDEAWLRRLRDELEAVAEPLRQLRAGLAGGASGEDPDGLVTVTVDGRGVPTSVRVAEDWPRRTTLPALADAVVAAGASATRALDARAREVLAGPQVRAGDQVGDVGIDVGSGLGGAAGGGVAAAATGPAWPVEELAEDAITLLAATRQAAPGAAPSVTGRALGGEVEVRLSPGGITACTLDGPRVRCGDAATLSRGLSEALAEARRALTAATARGTEAADRLLTESLALLGAANGVAGTVAS